VLLAFCWVLCSLRGLKNLKHAAGARPSHVWCVTCFAADAGWIHLACPAIRFGFFGFVVEQAFFAGFVGLLSDFDFGFDLVVS